MKQFLILTIISLSLYQSVPAQDLNKPDVLFFRLPDLQRSINKAEARNDQKDLAELKSAAVAMRQAIIRDFRMNFKFCTIYFFKESDLGLFKSGNWDKIVFWDKDEKIVQPKSSENYIVINYGIKPQVYTKSSDGKTLVSSNGQSRLEDGIVLRNKDIEPLEGNLVFTPAKLKKRGLGFLKPKSIDYVFYGAFQLELKLNKAFIPHPLAPKEVK